MSYKKMSFMEYELYGNIVSVLSVQYELYGNIVIIYIKKKTIIIFIRLYIVYILIILLMALFKVCFQNASEEVHAYNIRNKSARTLSVN